MFILPNCISILYSVLAIALRLHLTILSGAGILQYKTKCIKIPQSYLPNFTDGKMLKYLFSFNSKYNSRVFLSSVLRAYVVGLPAPLTNLATYCFLVGHCRSLHSVIWKSCPSWKVSDVTCFFVLPLQVDAQFILALPPGVCLRVTFPVTSALTPLPPYHSCLLLSIALVNFFLKI